MQLYPVRLPEKHLQILKDIARNQGKKTAVVLREAVAEYISTYSTVPSMKQLSTQVERNRHKVIEIEKVLIKEGLME